MSCYSYQQHLPKIAILGCGLLCLNAVLFAQESRQESRIDEEAGIEVLASGPVHEAFAEPIVFDPKPGNIVPKAPPQQVEELPPDQRPAGDNVAWIPGYWNWDEDREDYLWVSGFWRTLPPGREWVPGYWVEVTDGWQWVSGYWANAADDVTEYLPEPPETVEVGPSTPQPSPDHFWIPGCWYWRDAVYVWRPGYWMVGNPNWMWCPAHYVWTPRGFVFVAGYWDHVLPRRGMLFAPVYFRTPFYARRGYYFSPTMAVSLTILTDHFFVGLGHRHYYFGDYYASRYSSRGMYPWFAFASSRYGYDPIYSYYHSRHSRRDRDWADRIRSDYEFRRDHEEARPERVASRTPRIARQDGQRADGERPLVQPLSQLAAAQETHGAMVKLPDRQRTEIAKVAEQTREFTKERMKTETDAKSDVLPQPGDKKAETPRDPDSKAKGADKALRSATVKRPKSPIADAQKLEPSRGKKDEAPVIPEKPGPKVQPKASGKDLPAVPKGTPKVEPKPPTKEPLPKAEPKPPVKTPSVPKVEPPKTPPAAPKVEPQPKVRPEVPKTEPPPKVRPEVPKVEPPPKVRPEVPRAEPKLPKPSPPAGDKPRPSKPEKEPKK